MVGYKVLLADFQQEQTQVICCLYISLSLVKSTWQSLPVGWRRRGSGIQGSHFLEVGGEVVTSKVGEDKLPAS